MSQEFSVVGTRLPCLNAGAKATGATKYTVDIELPGMLIGRIMTSPHPHARILKIDKFKAEKLPGVEAVITFEDVPKKLFTRNSIAPFLRHPEGEREDQYVLADKARHVGDPIAAVAAIDANTVEEALGLIEVEYEVLPAVFDPIEAMKPDAPRIHDYAERNIAGHQPFPGSFGDVEKGFQEADIVVEDTFRTSKPQHCHLELSACVAGFDTEGRLTVWSPSQEVFPARTQIAALFDIPVGMIRWITPYVGGAFGAGCNLRAEPICIALAKKTGKPVKLEYTREQNFITCDTRVPFIHSVKLGVKKDGTITAIAAKLITHSGGYMASSSAITDVSMHHTIGLYRCQSRFAEANVVYTNTPNNCAFRGFGDPQAMWALEQLVDIACEEIGMDPMEFRLKNHARTGDPWVPGITLDSCALSECIKIGAEKIGWKEKRGRKQEGVRKRGVGMALDMHVSTSAPFNINQTGAFIKINEDGSFNLSVSACDMGQNILGALAQIAAEELGLQAEDIHIESGDTNINMWDAGQHASGSVYRIGQAVLKAAAEAKQQLLERAAKKLGVSAEELEVKQRRIYVKAAPEKGISVAEVARDAIYNFDWECLNISGKCTWEQKVNSPPFQATFAEVEVDTETGEVKPLKLVIVQDSGTIINPMTVEGQMEGGAVQGIGYALFEDYIINKDSGVIESDNFNTYKILRTRDVPEIEVVLVEQPVPSGPFGARGVGETALVAIAPAIANAIYDAVGIRITELPITPEKVINALETIIESTRI